MDVALANYHFGPKRDLFDAVLMRQGTDSELLASCARSKQAITDAATPSAPSVHEIIRSYFEPILTRPHVQEAGWKNYYALIAYVNSSPEWGGKLMTQFFDPLIERFIEALRMSLPDVPCQGSVLGVPLPFRRSDARFRADRAD